MKFIKNFDVIKRAKTILIITAAVLLLGALSMVILGFNVDIDFTGGTEIQYDIGRDLTQKDYDDINGIIEDLFGKRYVSSTTKDLNIPSLAIIRTGTAELTAEQQDKFLKKLDEFYGVDHTESTLFSINYISATVGDEMTETAIVSVIVAIVAMLIYIAFRFKSVDSALAAISGLAFSTFVMVAAYSIFNIPVDVNIIAALLTILGYSINATIIIFDRIRENNMKDRDVKTFAQIVSDATRQTLGRTLNTTLTTLLTILMIYIFGVDSIRDFALPLIIGILAGLFSSVCLSGYLWVKFDTWFKPLKDKLVIRKGARKAAKKKA
jgi:preprotein translocase SecF subunit